MKSLDSRLLYYRQVEQKRIESIIEKYDITYKEYVILKALDYADGQSIEELKSVVELDNENIVELVKSYIPRKIVEVIDGKVFLKEEYKLLFHKIKKDVRHSEDEVIDVLTYDKYRRLLNDLDDLIIALDPEK